jgi:hypothetical protein
LDSEEGEALSIDPNEYDRNEAWLLFRLNDAPIQTESDGDFNVMAILDIGTGLILGMEFIGLLEQELSEFVSRKMLASAELEAGGRPRQLLVDSQKNLVQLVETASAMGLVVIPESGDKLDSITLAAREGFAAHFSRPTTD